METVLSINYINDISTYKDIQIIQLCKLFRLFPGAAFLSKRREEEVCNSSIKIKAKNIYNYLKLSEFYRKILNFFQHLSDKPLELFGINFETPLAKLFSR